MGTWLLWSYCEINCLIVIKMPKINIADLDEFVEEEVNYEKIRNKKPRQYKEAPTKREKKNHREKKIEIWDIKEDDTD